MTVAHIFHVDADSLTTGSRLLARVAEIAAENDISVGAFIFGPAQRRLTQADTGTDLAQRGLKLSVVRDECIRFTLECVAVISFQPMLTRRFVCGISWLG